MAISEHDRYELHRWFEEHAGPSVAETLMAHLPPVGWADVATKRDLEMTREATRRDLDVLAATLRTEMHGMRADFHDTLRTHLMVILGFNLSLAGALAALLG